MKGAWVYLYRAVDKHGKTLDFMLSDRHQARANKLAMPRRVLRARSAWIAETCRHTAGRLQTLGGMSIIDNEDRAQNLWRDLQVMCAHADVRAREAYSGIGQHHLKNLKQEYQDVH